MRAPGSREAEANDPSFGSFAVNQWLQYRQVGRWRSYAFGEQAYLVLSLAAKSALAWQIFAGSLAS